MRFSAITLLFTIIFPIKIFAQEVDQSIDVYIQSTPANPKAGQRVSLQAISYAVDLNQAYTTWTYDGKNIASGTGKTSISVVAPANGRVSRATFSASMAGINPISATIIINPGSVDMLWEGVDSSTPPFYKGRTLVAPGGWVRVSAIPASGAPAQPIYQWYNNRSAVLGASGAGKSSIIIEHSVFNSQETVSVDVGGVFQGSGSISFSPIKPFAVAYQNKDGFVDYANGNTNTISTTQEGLTVRFEPFFFSTPTGNVRDDLLFSLKVADETVFGEDRSNEFRFSRPDVSGQYPLNLNINTATYSLQNIVKNFNLIFQ